MKTKFSGILTLLLALIVQISFAQQKTVTGTVTDAQGMPLPGVNILVENTNRGTQTDFDGNYSIAAAEGEVLVFSFLGMRSVEFTVGGASRIDATLEADAAQLQEVVVTALGIRREKQSLGFAQQTVDGEELTKARETNVNNALAGKVAGVQFTGAPSSGFNNSSIRLRGDSGVLYIVDNIKVNASSDINTDDIADMSVLKGAAATALYGPEGINGVIIITTKKAKAGESRITFDTSVAMENLYLLPEYQNEYGGGYSQDFNVFTFDPSRHPADWASFDGQKMVEYYADESWGPRMDGQMVRHWDSWIVGDPEFGKLRAFSPNPDNIRNFYDQGITTNNNLTMLKGGEGYSIRASIANIDRTGVVPNSSRNTIQGSLNASFDISDKLTAYSSINYQDRKTSNFPENGYGNIGSNFNQWWQRQLDMDRLRDYRRNGEIVSWNINSPTNTNPLYWDSPFFMALENITPQTKNAMYGKVGLQYEIIEDLTVDIEARKSLNSIEQNSRTGWGGLAQEAYSEYESLDVTDELFGILNYQRDLSEDFDLSANLGFETQNYRGKQLSSSSVGGLQAENFYSLHTSVDRPNVRGYEENSERKSLFAKASLGYQNLLYLDGSARTDWSSTANPENNRVETYGGSVSFIFSRLLPQSNFFTFGKLRSSIAQAPRFPNIYDIAETYAVGTPYGSYGTLSVRNQLNNPFLTGGVRQEIEFGTELRFLNNRLGLDVTYFEKTDSKLPVSISLDAATGYTSTRDNQGEQFYKGWEISFNAVPVRTEDFLWDFTANFATLERFVVRIAEGVETNILSQTWRGIQLQERAGEEWGAIYGRAYRRDESGNILLSSTGNPRYDTNVYLGNVLPDFTGGLSNYFRYKNFGLGVDFDFQKGGKIFSTTRMFNNYSGLGIETVGNNAAGNPVRNDVTGTGVISGRIVKRENAGSDTGGVLISGVDETTGQPAAYYVEASTYWGRLFALHENWLYDASYFKLRQARLDYTFSPASIENLPIKELNIGVFANNVWLIHSALPGLDPSEIEGQNGIGWTEGGQSPNTRSVGVNVRLSF